MAQDFQSITSVIKNKRKFPMSMNERKTPSSKQKLSKHKEISSEESASDIIEEIECEDTAYQHLHKSLKRLCDNPKVKWAFLSELSTHDKEDWLLFGEGVSNVIEDIKDDKSLKGYKIKLLETSDSNITDDYGIDVIRQQETLQEENGFRVKESRNTCGLFLEYEPLEEPTIIYAVVTAHLLLNEEDSSYLNSCPQAIREVSLEKYQEALSHPQYIEFRGEKIDLDSSGMIFDFYVHDQSGKYESRDEKFAVDIAIIPLRYDTGSDELKSNDYETYPGSLEGSMHTKVDILSRLRAETSFVGGYEVHPGILNISSHELMRMCTLKKSVFIGERLLPGTLLRPADPVEGLVKKPYLVTFSMKDKDHLPEDGDSGSIVYVRSKTDQKLYRLALFKGVFNKTKMQYHAALLCANIEAIKKISPELKWLRPWGVKDKLYLEFSEQRVNDLVRDAPESEATNQEDQEEENNINETATISTTEQPVKTPREGAEVTLATDYD